MSTEVEFVDELPPHLNRAGVEVGRWMRILSPLIERPGEWAIVSRHEKPTSAAATAMNLRRRRVYARYLNGETA